LIKRRIARLKLTWPVMRLAWQYVDDGDAWQSLPHDVPLFQYAPGCKREFQWYLDGESAVDVSSVDDICDWLLGCEYRSDWELFRQDDFWQHPITFEQLRKGDCEDFALWAWRKLRRIGLETELMLGQWLARGVPGDHYHAWVVFRDPEGHQYLLESVARARPRMVQPLAMARADYRPHLSVGHDLTRRVYAGLCAWIEQRRAERNALRRKGRDGSKPSIEDNVPAETAV
jgi:hypothetical protein